MVLAVTVGDLSLMDHKQNILIETVQLWTKIQYPSLPGKDWSCHFKPTVQSHLLQEERHQITNEGFVVGPEHECFVPWYQPKGGV